jgi:hypothetical protein
MQYIETLEPLEPHFLVKEFATPEEYKSFYKVDPPAFDETKPIKLWSWEPPASNTRQVLFDTIALDENGNWLYDSEGKYVTELILMLRSESPKVNIPPKDFNFTGKPLILKQNRPLRPGFVDEYDIVKSPDGFSVVARNKEKYKKYLQTLATSGGSNPEFETKVLQDLAAIKKVLGI